MTDKETKIAVLETKLDNVGDKFDTINKRLEEGFGYIKERFEKSDCLHAELIKAMQEMNTNVVVLQQESESNKRAHGYIEKKIEYACAQVEDVSKEQQALKNSVANRLLYSIRAGGIAGGIGGGIVSALSFIFRMFN